MFQDILTNSICKSGSRSLALQGYFISITSKLPRSNSWGKMLNKQQRMKDCMVAGGVTIARLVVGVREKWLIIRVFI